MALHKEHELHHRRRGRNVGLGLVLAGFVVLVLSLTMVKVTSNGFQFPSELSQGSAN
ncbi:cytochrome C oxidase assembly protein [Epibacterium sp. SM1969]|uniref:Cytochrome C oxidase assembly protein n=1 Tax=Tritonibacter aquimaris TaxID=2663379 RepID=A0A844AUK2_9RHOB|nr:cytochrome C oxidase assembly protein [Tritonibacter aquimaris]MQY43108.1 cytochrome C oxidase assembly protein [Tritonibacter aquimaris]